MSPGFARRLIPIPEDVNTSNAHEPVMLFGDIGDAADENVKDRVVDATGKLRPSISTLCMDQPPCGVRAGRSLRTVRSAATGRHVDDEAIDESDGGVSLPVDTVLDHPDGRNTGPRPGDGLDDAAS